MTESIQFRKWVDAAIREGVTSPSRVLEWIEQHKSEETEAPSLPTISKILREKGYEPTGIKWEQKKRKG